MGKVTVEKTADLDHAGNQLLVFWPKNQSVVELTNKAQSYANKRTKQQIVLNKTAQRNRHIVNMLRHSYTNYDTVVSTDNQIMLQIVVGLAISQDYPFLAKECCRQLTVRSQSFNDMKVIAEISKNKQQYDHYLKNRLNGPVLFKTPIGVAVGKIKRKRSSSNSRTQNIEVRFKLSRHLSRTIWFNRQVV